MNSSLFLVLGLAACVTHAAYPMFDVVDYEPKAERCCHCKTGLDHKKTKIEAIGNKEVRVIIVPTYGSCSGADKNHF